MLARSLCAFLLLASPAAALDVFEDLTLTEANYPGGPIKVYGSASLTIAGNPITARIELYDNATLELQSGSINGSIEVRGANAVRQTGGTINRIDVLSREATSYELLGGHFWGTLQGPYAGEHRVTIDFDGYTLAPSTIGAPGMTVSASASDPLIRTREGYPEIGSYASAGPNPAFSKIVLATWELNATDGLAGDANGDGVVDLADLNAVRNAFGNGTGTAAVAGDTLPYNGVVDLDDLNRVRNAFGSSASVPEPATAFLMALAFPSLLLLIRSNRATPAR
jgi:hypothetical protein